jgi:glycosyltransferase involved in cell wall biosynthesis
VSSTRPTNAQLWLIQLLGVRPKAPVADYFYCSLFPGIKLVKECKRIIRVHDPFGHHRSAIRTFFESQTRLKLRLAKALRTKAFVKNSNRSVLIFNSCFTKRRCEEIYGPAKQSYVIHNLVQFDGLGPTVLKDESREYLLIISGSRQRKKPEVIINIWAESPLSGKVDLIVVGNVPNQLLGQKANSLMHLGKLTILKGLDGQDLRSLVENCIATIFYSLGEGWGQPLAESVFCGKVVICNDLEVFHEVAGEHGRYFSTANPHHFLPLAFELLKEKKNDLLDEMNVLEYGRRYGLEILKLNWQKVLEEKK